MRKNEFEQWVQETAGDFRYPPTPQLRVQQSRQQPRRRRLALVGLLLLVFGSLLVVPQVRATLFELLPAGAVQIFLLPNEATPSAATDAPLALTRLGSGRLVTLAEANAELPFAILLPSVLPPPDAVYLHDEEITAVSLAWYGADQEPNLLLSQMDEVGLLGKWAFAQQTTTVAVDGQEAYWIQGRHLLQPLRYERLETAVVVDSNVLVWTDETRSYRLEGAATVAEALRIAKALR